MGKQIGRSQPTSPGYRQWRRQFVKSRLKLSIWIAIASQLFLDAIDILVVEPLHRTSQQLTFYVSGKETIESLQTIGLSAIVLGICLLLIRLPRLRHAPIHLLPIFTFAVLIIPEQLYHIQATQQLNSDIIADIAMIFWAQAILVPVQWPSHLLAQLLSIAWIAALGSVGWLEKGLNTASPGTLLDIGWGVLYCLLIIVIANCMVWYSERLIYHEFSLREQLQHSLKTISQDLKQPILDNQRHLKALAHLPNTATDQVTPTRSRIDRSIQMPEQTVQTILTNSYRQLDLLTALTAAEHHE